MEGHVQAKFKTNIKGLSIPDHPFSLPISSESADLDALIKSLLKDSNQEVEKYNFDFLVNSILLRVSVKEFIEEQNLSQEDVLSIECVLKEQPPKFDSNFPHADWVSVVKSTKEFLVSGSYDNSLQIWLLKTRKQICQISNHDGPIKTACLVPTVAKENLCFASGSQDQTVRFWNFNIKNENANCSWIGKGHERSVESLCSNFDGTILASGSFDTFIKIWNTEASTSDDQIDDPNENNLKKKKTETGNKNIVKTPMVTLAGHREVVSGLVWTDLAEIVSCSWDRNISFWDLNSASQKSQLTSSVALTSIAQPPLNKMFITGSTDPYVRLWDPRAKASSGAQAIFASHTGWVTCVDWSKTNENLFISGSYDRMVKQWDARSYKAPLYNLSAHEDRVLCCDWTNPDNIVSGGVDNMMRVYSVVSK